MVKHDDSKPNKARKLLFSPTLTLPTILRHNIEMVKRCTLQTPPPLSQGLTGGQEPARSEGKRGEPLMKL